ncbi:MAG: MFS transporter [Myxococcota bacterium]|nr:MFS transporter [Myxococcota bacterium]
MSGGVDRREHRLLLLLGAAAFFSMYDQALLSLLLVQIQADLAIPEGQLGLLGSLVRLGSLPAFAVLLLADRLGRRRLLLATIIGYTFFTAATALAPGFGALIAFQLLARTFVTAEWLLAVVVIVEEFRETNRGLGIGLLGTLAALGHGLAMILFGAVEHVPFGWRGLYALGVLPLLAIAFFRRRLPETGRFEHTRATTAAASSTAGWLEPLRGLLTHAPRRLAAVVAVHFFWSFSNAPVDFFLPKFFQEVHGWTPAHFALVAVLGGALGLCGQPIGGWLSDRRGRRPALVGFTLLEPLAALALYSVLGPIAVGLYVAWVFCSVGNDVVGRTAAQELFPTSARATAAGVAAVVGTLGGMLGLACEGALFALLGSHWLGVRALAVTGLVAAVVVARCYPETSGRSLEEIAPEPGATGPAWTTARRPCWRAACRSAPSRSPARSGAGGAGARPG